MKVWQAYKRPVWIPAPITRGGRRLRADVQVISIIYDADESRKFYKINTAAWANPVHDVTHTKGLIAEVWPEQQHTIIYVNAILLLKWFESGCKTGWDDATFVFPRPRECSKKLLLVGSTNMLLTGPDLAVRIAKSWYIFGCDDRFCDRTSQHAVWPTW